jgi:hypothetical protein
VPKRHLAKLRSKPGRVDWELEDVRVENQVLAYLAWRERHGRTGPIAVYPGTRKALAHDTCKGAVARALNSRFALSNTFEWAPTVTVENV